MLLKEIGDLPLSTQSKLVRLVRDGAYERLGGSARTANATILATSSDDLERAVAEGRFQSDLLYELAVFTIHIPPLRQRRDDIPLLVDHIIKNFAGIRQTLGDEVARISDEALRLLAAYDWPGNVDELQCVLKRALIEGKGAVVATESLARTVGQPNAGVAAAAAEADSFAWSGFLANEMADGGGAVYAHAVAAVERGLLPLVLTRCGGSQVKAAQCLGMTRGSLRKKLRAHGLLSAPGNADDETPAEGSDEDVV